MVSIKGGKVPKFLFIREVFKKDCMSDDIFEKKILENVVCDAVSTSETLQDNFISYEKLPSTFVDIETWKKKTNIKCWYCTLSFDTIPIFIPKVIEPIMVKNKIEREKINKPKFSISVYGTFCSFGCAHFFIESRNFSIADRIEYINKLKLLHKLIYNTKIREIGYYPNPYQLEQYGGHLTVQEYKAMQEEYKRENIPNVQQVF